jgi:hypothetical protein
MGGLEATLKNKDIRKSVEAELEMMAFLLCEKVDAFSVKCGEKAKNPRDFSEVAQEMKTMKKEIKEYVDRKAVTRSTGGGPPIEKGALEFYIERKLSKQFDGWQKSNPQLFSKRTLKERIDFCVTIAPSEIDRMINNTPLSEEANKALKKLFNVKDKDAEFDVEPDKTGKLGVGQDIKEDIMNFAIILDALAGGADKPVKEQIKDFKYITLRREERIARYGEENASRSLL